MLTLPGQVDILQSNFDVHGPDSSAKLSKFSFTGGVVVKITENQKAGDKMPLKFFALAVDQCSTTVEVSSFNQAFDPKIGDAVIGLLFFFLLKPNITLITTGHFSVYAPMGKPYSLNVNDQSIFTIWTKSEWIKNHALKKVFDGFQSNFNEETYSQRIGSAEKTLKEAVDKKAMSV